MSSPIPQLLNVALSGPEPVKVISLSQSVPWITLTVVRSVSLERPSSVGRSVHTLEGVRACEGRQGERRGKLMPLALGVLEEQLPVASVTVGPLSRRYFTGELSTVVATFVNVSHEQWRWR